MRGLEVPVPKSLNWLIFNKKCKTLFSFTDFEFSGFNIDMCRSMVASRDVSFVNDDINGCHGHNTALVAWQLWLAEPRKVTEVTVKSMLCYQCPARVKKIPGGPTKMALCINLTCIMLSLVNMGSCRCPIHKNLHSQGWGATPFSCQLGGGGM